MVDRVPKKSLWFLIPRSYSFGKAFQESWSTISQQKSNLFLIITDCISFTCVFYYFCFISIFNIPREIDKRNIKKEKVIFCGQNLMLYGFLKFSFLKILRKSWNNAKSLDFKKICLGYKMYKNLSKI